MHVLHQRHCGRPVEVFMAGSFLLLCMFLLFYTFLTDDRQLALPPDQHQHLQHLLRFREQQLHISKSPQEDKDPQQQPRLFIDEPTKVIASGYLRSFSHCPYANADLTALEANVCGSDDLPQDSNRRLFHWTNFGHVMIMGKCLTHNNNRVTLDYCYENNPYQVFTQPNEDQFILTGFSTCLHLKPWSGSQIHSFHVGDCWQTCPGFKLATWFLLNSPNATLDPKTLEALQVKENEPWQQRYCLNHVALLGKPKPKQQKKKQ